MANAKIKVGDRVKLSDAFCRRVGYDGWRDRAEVVEVRALGGSAHYVKLVWDHPEEHTTGGALAANLEVVPSGARPA